MKKIVLQVLCSIVLALPTIHLNAQENNEPNYLRFTAIKGNIQITSIREMNHAQKYLLYKYDYANEWQTVQHNTPINIPEGTSVLLKAAPKGNYTFQNTPIKINGDGELSLSGDITTILDADGTLDAVPYYCFSELFANSQPILYLDKLNLTPQKLSYACYSGMFRGCTIKSLPLLPATELAERCYENMFFYAKILTDIPSDFLHATQLAPKCYAGMFSHSQIKEIPTNLLPASELTTECYCRMFESSNISTIPPYLLQEAKKLSPRCYFKMFADCDNITQISEYLLPSADLDTGCYNQMFSQCNNLQNIPMNFLPQTTLKDSCYWGMFSDCTSLCMLPENLLPASNLSKNCYENMFANCASITVLPEKFLPSSNLSAYCYKNMFAGCCSLTLIPEKLLHAKTLSIGCYWGMFSHCSSLKNIPPKLLQAHNLADDCYTHMFMGCNSLRTIPENLLPATTLTQRCYFGMFQECESLVNIPENLLPSLNLQDCCYGHLFYHCIALINIPKKLLPAKKLAERCYEGMFCGCTSLVCLPENFLPATSLAESCYERMFAGCSRLNNIPEKLLPAQTLSPRCYSHMFFNCSSLTKAPYLPANTLVDLCYHNMFENCIELSYIKVNFIQWEHKDVIWPNYGTYCWVRNVGKTGAFFAPENLNLIDNDGNILYDNGHIPQNWVINPFIINLNGGEYGNDVLYSNENNKFILTGQRFERSNYTQIGWSISENSPSIDYELNGVYTATEHITLYPVWKQNICKVTFVRGDYCTQGTSSITIETSTDGFFSIPENAMDFSRDGYVHIGWSTKENGDKEYAYNEKNIYTDEDLILYPVFEKLQDYVGFTSKSSAQIWLTKQGDEDWNAPIVEFSTDGGRSWTICDYNSPQKISINKGDKVCFRAGGELKKNETFSLSPEKRIVFAYIGSKSSIDVSGNIMTLLDASGKNITTAPDYCFFGLFSTVNDGRNYDGTTEDMTLRSAQNLQLPATNLGKACYANMFTTNFCLEYPPIDLPATILSDSCYAGMFSCCYNLKESPYLPAINLKPYCYMHMFNMNDCANNNQFAKSLEKITVNFNSWRDDIHATDNWVEGVDTRHGTFNYSNHNLEKPKGKIEVGSSRKPNEYWSPYTIDFQKEYSSLNRNILKSISLDDITTIIDPIITTNGTFILSGETFYKYGYTQTGWTDGENDYELTGTYSTDHDLTLYPIWKMKTTIEGASSICNDYQVETYTLANINEESSYQWNLSNNSLAKIVSKTNTSVTIQTIGYGQGNIELTVSEYHDDIIIGEQTQIIHINQRPTGSIVIENDWITVCPYATQTISTQYDGDIHWEVSNGILLNSVLNNNTISFTTSDKNGYIKAFKQNGDGCIAYESKTITIQLSASNCNKLQNYSDGEIKPIDITGDKFICADSYSMWNRSYSINDRNSQCTYNWSLTENNLAEIATYSDGINGNITIVGNAGNEDLTLTVQEIKNGFVIRESVFPITIRIRPTFTNEQILGPSNVCPNEMAVEYSMSQAGEYYWYLSDGTEPIIGQGETSAAFNFGRFGTNIFVKKQNGENCLSYSPINIWVGTQSSNCGNGLKSFSLTNEITSQQIFIKDDTTNLSVSFFPVPTKSVLYINTNANIESVTIFTISGNEVLFCTKTKTIDISELNSGNYIVEVKTDIGTVRKNIIITK